MTNAWRQRLRGRDPERARAIAKAQRQRYWARHGAAKNLSRKFGITIAEARADLASSKQIGAVVESTENTDDTRGQGKSESEPPAERAGG